MPFKPSAFRLAMTLGKSLLATLLGNASWQRFLATNKLGKFKRSRPLELLRFSLVKFLLAFFVELLKFYVPPAR